MDIDLIRKNLNESIFRVANELATVASEFGPKDYPGDWVDFRNYLFGFIQAFFQAIDHFLQEEPADLWTRCAEPIIEQLRPEQLVKIAGSCHYYIASTYPFQFADRETTQFADRETTAKDYIITLNWITNIYGFSPDATKRWFDLGTTPMEHADRMRALENMAYQEIAFATLSDPADEQRAKAWAGLALMAVFIQFTYEEEHPEEWYDECRQIFGD